MVVGVVRVARLVQAVLMVVILIVVGTHLVGLHCMRVQYLLDSDQA